MRASVRSEMAFRSHIRHGRTAAVWQGGRPPGAADVAASLQLAAATDADHATAASFAGIAVGP